MFNEKDIFARLQNGENIETIANELTAALNEANKKYMEIQKQEEEAKRTAAKAADLQAILNALYDWTVKYYAETEGKFNRLSAEEVLEIVDEVEDFLNILNTVPKKKETEPVKTVDDVINDFLKAMKW